MAVLLFKLIWAGLLLIALSAQALFKGRLVKKGGIVAILLVVAPYLVVFGWFSVRDYIGIFKPIAFVQISGLVLNLSGACGYIISILYLRKNWSVSAAVKEGHILVNKGPYRFVRHPMYFFMSLVVLGSGLLISNFLIILYTPVVVFLYYLRAKKEEEMLKKDLPGYEEYCKKTRMLLPGVF